MNTINKLPIITTLFWTIFLFGYWLLPEIFRKELVLLPTTLVLSILLPVSFWQLATNGKRVFALFIVGIFLFNGSFLSVIVQENYAAQQGVAREIMRGMQPTFAEYVETGASSSKRKLAAQLFYRLHGIVLPYKNDTASYTLYVPEQGDKDKYRENSRTTNTLKLKEMELAASLQTTVLLLLIHVALFTGLLIFLLL